MIECIKFTNAGFSLLNAGLKLNKAGFKPCFIQFKR